MFLSLWVDKESSRCWFKKDSRKYYVIKGRLPVIQVFIKAHLNVPYNDEKGLNICR